VPPQFLTAGLVAELLRRSEQPAEDAGRQRLLARKPRQHRPVGLREQR
jgi:hypothetical protein